MAVRKSRNIGNIINGYLVIDSRRKGNDTEYYIECTRCNSKYWKSRGFIRAKARCPCCENGRNYRNAQGYEHERLYKRYRNILRRVKDNNRYKGVTICNEWEHDYLAFRKWALDNGYDDSLTIDRIDNNKGYEPSNCRWVNAKKQANNRKSNHVIEYNGVKYTVSELSDLIKLPYNTVLLRINNGWSIEDVVKTPYKNRKKWSEEHEKNRVKSGVCTY